MYYLNLSAGADEFKAARRRLRSDLSGKRLAARPSRRPLIEQSASAEKCRRETLFSSGKSEEQRRREEMCRERTVLQRRSQLAKRWLRKRHRAFLTISRNSRTSGLEQAKYERQIDPVLQRRCSSPAMHLVT